MKYEYDRFFVEGGAEEMLKKVNEFGADGWEVFHVTEMNREANTLGPLHAVWVKREVHGRKKKNDD